MKLERPEKLQRRVALSMPFIRKNCGNYMYVSGDGGGVTEVRFWA